MIGYKIIKVGKEETIVVNAKVKKLERRWITVDSYAARKSAKLAEKARKESDVEEKNSHQENDAAASTIEQRLDYAAKPMSDRQIYIGCILSDVKDRLQEMKDAKGEDYAMNYITTHWPKIDLSKVL